MSKYGHKKPKSTKPDPPPAPVPEPVQEQVSQQPQSIPEKPKKSKRERVWKKPESPVAVATLVAAVVVAIIYFFQLQTMQTTLENTQREDAPVIWVTPDPPKFAVGQRLVWDVHYTNYGHSTALNIHTCFTAAYGPKGIRAWDDLHFPTASECSTLPNKSSGVAPPAFSGYSSVVGDKNLSDLDVRNITDIDGGVLVYGIITYEDIAGHTYETDFCDYRLQTGAIMHCEQHNSIKRTS